MIKICIIISIISLVFYITVSIIEKIMIKKGKIKKRVSLDDRRTIPTVDKSDKSGQWLFKIYMWNNYIFYDCCYV